MNTRLALCLALAFFFCGTHAAKITFTNNCHYTVWPVTQAGDEKPQLSSTGFKLAAGASKYVDLPCPWSGRFWGRTGCSSKSGKFTCATADCGSGKVACNGASAAPPATVAELTVASDGGLDCYDISNVNGFNVPMSIAPQGGTGECKQSSCPANINAACPPVLQLKGSGGKVIACKSACLAFNQPKYCCTGDFEEPGKCPRTKYSEFFEKQCPQAYSYAQDETNSAFTCSSNPDYRITFCP